MITNSEEFILERVAEVDKEIETCMKAISSILHVVKTCADESDSDREEHARKIHNFLKYVLTQLDDNEGLEKFLLPHLEHFRNQNKIRLLPKACEVPRIISSKQNVNYDDESISDIWHKLVHYLEVFSLRELQQNVNKSKPSEIFTINLHIKNYINLLKAVYEPNIVWEQYQRWRVDTLKQFNAFCGEHSCFTCLLKFCFYNICEDQVFVHMNDFQPIFITWSHIFALYFKFILDQIKLLVLEVKNWSGTIELPVSLHSVLMCAKQSRYCRMCCSCSISKKSVNDISESLETLKNYTSSKRTEGTKHFSYMHSSVVLQMVTSLLKFEYQISALTTGVTNIPEHLHFHDFDLNIVSQGTKFTLPFESPDTSPVHDYHDKSQEGNLESFSKQWRIIFESELLTEMQKMLQRNVEDIMYRHIEQEKLYLFDNDIQSLLSGNSCNLISANIQIHTVLPSVINTIAELERFLPLVYSSDGPFLPVKASFSHVINTYLIDLIKHLKFISHGPSRQYCIQCLYIASSSAVFLRDRLNTYNRLISNGNKSESRHLTGICDKVNDMTNGMVEEMEVHNWKYVSCGILFDACSYDFEDTNAFYEGERVSYCIQMWNLYMKGFLSDIQFYLPQVFAQSLYAKILCDSLLQFCTRYAHISPTEARTSQVKTDILTILLCVSQLINPLCNISAQFTNREIKGNSEDAVAVLVTRIHSVCCTMITILAILTSPITEIYKVFGKNFPTVPLSLWTKYSSLVPWLLWIRPSLFPQLGKEPLLSSVAVWLAVRICTSWLQPNPTAIMKAYTEHHSTLSTLLMSQASETSEELSEFGDKDYMDKKLHKVKLATSIFQLLSFYKSHVDNISDILLLVIERNTGWIEFDKSKIDKSISERPWWYQGFLKTIDPLMKSVVCGFLPLLLQFEKKFSSILVRDAWEDMRNKLDELSTCTCEDNFDYSPADRRGSLKKKMYQTTARNQIFNGSEPIPISYACILNILEGISDNLLLIPVPVRQSLSSVDVHFKNYISDAEPVYQSIPLQVFVSTLITYLNDPEVIYDFTGYKLSREGINLCYFVGQTLKCVALNILVSIDMSAIQFREVEKCLNHIVQQFETLRSGTDSLLSQKSQKDGIEQELNNLAAKELLAHPEGKDTILYLQKLLCLNESWIQQSLGIPELFSTNSVISNISPTPLTNQIDHCGAETCVLSSLSSQATSSSLLDKNKSTSSVNAEKKRLQDFKNVNVKKQCLELEEAKAFRQYELNLNVEEFSLEYNLNFNPLEHFDQLGESKFNKAAESMSDLPWEALLSHLPVLGLTEVGFCNLFRQRWDVRGEGPVPIDQKLMIQELKAKYDIP